MMGSPEHIAITHYVAGNARPTLATLQAHDRAREQEIGRVVDAALRGRPLAPNARDMVITLAALVRYATVKESVKHALDYYWRLEQLRFLPPLVPGRAAFRATALEGAGEEDLLDHAGHDNQDLRDERNASPGQPDQRLVGGQGVPHAVVTVELSEVPRISIRVHGTSVELPVGAVHRWTAAEDMPDSADGGSRENSLEHAPTAGHSDPDSASDSEGNVSLDAGVRAAEVPPVGRAGSRDAGQSRRRGREAP